MSHLWRIAVVLLLALPVEARTVADVAVAETLNLDGQALQLNGAGVRKKLFIKVYVAALYLPRKTQDPGQAVMQSGTKRMLMHFVYSKVSREKLVAAWNEGFEGNTDAATLATLGARIDRFNNLFPALKAGDTVWLDLLPGKGVRISINGEMKDTIAGDDFAQALLRIWLGESPVTESLKAALLGQD